MPKLPVLFFCLFAPVLSLHLFGQSPSRKAEDSLLFLPHQLTQRNIFLNKGNLQAKNHVGQSKPFPNYTPPSLSKKTSITAFSAEQANKTLQDVCHIISGRDHLFQDSIELIAQYLSPAKDGKIIISGIYTDFGAPQLRIGGFVAKTDTVGNAIWAYVIDSAAINPTNFTNYSYPFELRNGNILLLGRTSNHVSKNDDFIITQLNPDGEIIWTKTYESVFWQGFNGSGDYFNLVDVKEDPIAGSIYITGSFWDGITSITRIEPSDGRITWSIGRKFNSITGNDAIGLDINENELILFSLVNDYLANNISINKINKSDGSILSSKALKYDYSSNPQKGILSVDGLIRLNNGHYRIPVYFYGYFESPTYTGTVDMYHAGYVELDINFDFVRAIAFTNRLESNWYGTRISLFPDGSGVFTMRAPVSNYSGTANVVIFKDDKIYNQRARFHNNEIPYFEPFFIQIGNGNYLNIRTITDGQSTGAVSTTMDFYRIHSGDNSSDCIGITDSSSQMQAFDFIPASVGEGLGYHDVFRESRPKTMSQWPIRTYTTPACRIESKCDSVKLIADKTVTCVSEEFVVTIRKNQECGSLTPLTWDPIIADPPIKLTDSSFLFKIIAPGSGFIETSIMGCDFRTDTIHLNIQPVKYNVNLGTDTVLCPNNQIKLNAGDGFNSYEWQDGSADSIFVVTTPGTYYVTASNQCGGSFADTIIVMSHPPIVLDLGADLKKCNDDAIEIQAPADFISYSWTQENAIIIGAEDRITVSPLSDTKYYLTAEKKPGCFAYDSIQVIVNKSPVIFLGADTSLCNGDSLVLSTGPNFAEYIWSTGSAADKITVKSAGQYVIQATDLNGCISYDTLNILNIFPLPNVNLQSPGYLCEGETRTLSAGTGFTSYEWNTGSTSPSISIASTGQYAVIVRDNRGCSAQASVTIDRQMPLPNNFLPADTSICTYQKLNVKPSQLYQTYLWNTGETGASIQIPHSGVYWLKVTDRYNCTGTDTILVNSKQCMLGFFIPKAFTPNGDGLNDDFKPLLFGNIMKYEFIVYNRWGQVVFKSSQTDRGWDGNYNGKSESGNVFIWTCRYQLEGEEVKLEKGTVTLIR